MTSINMTRFELYNDHDEDYAAANESQSTSISCCDDSEQSCLTNGSCTTSQESLSFDASSFCDDYHEEVVASDNNKVGSTVFQDFSLCFNEIERMQHQRVLLPSSSSALVPTSSRALRVRTAPSSSPKVSLPQFLWRPEAGLCGYALETNYGAHHNTTNNPTGGSSPKKNTISEELIVFHDDDDNEKSIRNNDHEPLLRPGSQLSTSCSIISEGGTLQDPRYVPRPSSTTPGLREMSKFFRNLSIAETNIPNNNKTTATELVKAKEPIHSDSPLEVKNTDIQGSSGEKSLDLATAKTTVSKTPQPLGRFLQRRSRSEIKPNDDVSFLTSPPASVSGSIMTSWTTKDGHAARHRRSSSEDCASKRGKSSSLVASFLRRTPRLVVPSFLKTQLSQKSLVGENNSKDRLEEGSSKKLSSTEGLDSHSSADIANILASLEDSLKEKVTQVANSSSIQASVGVAKQSEPLSTQGSGETSDTSSLFGGMESDSEEDSCCSEESENADRFFATPYYPNRQRWTTKASSSRPPLNMHSQLGVDDMSVGDSWDTPSMISSRTELTRCSSVDTAKASNLSCDPGADRARLLEIQAYLWQQQQERERVLNAPPVEFFHNDNVIRVREAACETIDAACEIEVLPKEDLQSSCEEQMSIPPTAAEF